MEGIVLRTIPYGERDRILTLFTPAGLIKLFVKGKRQLDLRLQALTSPFTRGDYLYNIRKSELYRFIDGTVHDQHLELRDCLDKLNTAQKMVNALLESQWPNKPSAELFHLFALFLKKTCTNPHLLPFFLIKLLKHEGILPPDDPELQLIAHTRSFAELETLKITPSLLEKTEELFHMNRLYS